MRRSPGLIGIVAVAMLVVGVVACGLASAAARTPNATRARLSLVLPQMKFTNVAMSDAVDFLRDVSGANIHVNWRALEELGVGRDTPVNVNLRSVSLRKMLNVLVNETGVPGQVTWVLDDNVIEITTREIADRQLFLRVYPIDDLLMEIPDFSAPDFSPSSGGGGSGEGGGGGGGDPFEDQDEEDEEAQTKTERADEIIGLIQETIQPDIWRDNGGVATIRFYNGSLIVTAPRSVHEAIGGPVD